MSLSTHVMAQPAMPSFTDHAWVERENKSRSNAVSSHEPLPQLVKPGKRGRKGTAPATNGKPKSTAAPKDSSRSERSLGMLTKLFIQLLKDESGTLDLNKTADKLKVQKRRIYDITNVLEGIHLIEKFKKNNVRWKGVSTTNTVKLPAGCKTATLNRQRRDDLLQERARLEQEHARLLQMRAQVDGAIRDTLTNENTARFAYVTMDDIKKVDSLQDSLVLAVNTPYETYMQVDDGSADLSKPFVMNLEHKTQAGDVKLSSFVVPPRCPGSPFQSSSESSTEGSTDYSSSDDDSSNYDDSCSDSDLSSSSDEYSESDYSSSDEDEDMEPKPSTPVHTINNHTIASGLPRQDILEIYNVAMAAQDDDCMSE